jgi:hypothetical protein
MKKYIFTVGIILTMIFSLSSCSDSFLDLDSPSKLPADQYYTTKAHMAELLVTAYTPMAYFDWSQKEYTPLNVVSDVMSDDVWPGGSSATDNENWHLMGNFSATPEKVIHALWIDCYTGIHRCNYVMEYMPNVTDIDDATKNLYIAEATVLRAYYYSILWKFWGAIPYYTTNLTFPYVSAKSSEADVYKGIITDLQSAIALNVLPMKETDSSLNGRVTLAFAYMVYADVVMYEKDKSLYPQALTYMNDIINSGKYSLTPNYADIWTEAGEWNDECIFAINYFNQGAARSFDNPYYVGGTVTPTLISPYGVADGTECNGVKLSSGWGFCPVREDAYNAFEAGDTRRDASINDLRNVKYTPRYEDTGFWLRKYCARTGYNDGQVSDAQMNFGNDLRIYRYAETLLNAAELILDGAGSGNAQGLLDQVRTRAGLGSKTATIDNIINERRFEFMGEGKRYFDLVRTDKAADALGVTGFRTKAWTANKKYLPIPQAEINSSDGQLEQNTDY